MADSCGDPSAFVPVRAVTVTTEVISVPELVMNALAPLMHPLVTLERGPRARGSGIRPTVGLGEAEAGERPARDQVG